MLPLTLLAVAALLIACGVVAVLVAWHPSRTSMPPSPPSWAPQPSRPSPSQPSERGSYVHAWCEHIVRREDGSGYLCGAPATYELGAVSTNEEVAERAAAGAAGGFAIGAAVVADYCPEHAPAGAVLVR